MTIKEKLRAPLFEFMENQITAAYPAEVIDAVKLSKPHRNDRYIEN